MDGRHEADWPFGSVGRHFELLLLSGPVNSATVDIHVQVFVQLCGFCTFLSESLSRVVPLCLKGQFESPFLADKP